jgi:eukaryotic-like serine/threonine-protein kinase
MSEPTHGALSPGQIFHGRYEIVRCLKAGGMGAVYECVHRQTRKRRALKVMLPQLLADADLRGRFELEARVTADIESEHIVETFDAGIDDATGAPFLVMELLRGEDLASVLERRGRLPAGEAVGLLAQAALALDKTHAAGIVHRDLKPENLHVTTRDDGSQRLKILDFGIAKVVADVNRSIKQTATIGTPLYMSQEQILGEGTIGPRADVYALGHIAFALLTGDAYWADEQETSPAIYAFLARVMAGPPEAATARAARRGVVLPPVFDPWFARATASAATDRFDRASTLVHALGEALGVAAPGLVPTPVVAPSLAGATTMLAMPTPGGHGATTPVPSIRSIESTSKPSRLRVAMIGVGAIGLVGLGLLLGRGASQSPAPAAHPASTALVAVTAPAAAMSAPEPTSTPSVALAPASSVGVPATTATLAPASPRPRPPPAQPPTPSHACNPPYTVTSTGHHVMKPQCL